MMILRSSPASPFVPQGAHRRRSCSGLADKIEVRETDLNDPADAIRKQNPLGKIPALILDDGTALLRLARDPRSISIISPAAAASFRASRRRALRRCGCRRCATASSMPRVLLVYEGRYRPADKHVQAWIDRQADKVARGLAALEAAPPRAHADARRRADRARLRARLSRSAFRRHVAQGSSAPRRLARQIRRPGAGLRRDQSHGV